MTQFKDKAGSQRDLVSAGLFFYPVLQAADVLAYRANEVPVGEDQRQHVELMRDVAERFNARFGETLVVPELRVPAVGARIMDLQVPDKKMSTTGGTPQGTVLVLDEPDAIVKKFRSAVTDSGSEVVRGPDKAGISNLIDILAAVRGIAPEEVEQTFDGSGYGAFKQAVADAVVEYLAPVRERYQELRADESALERILAEGAEKARAIAVRHPARRPPGDGRRTGPGPTLRRRRQAPPTIPVACRAMRIADLELDLDVFAGPFDLLLTLILREEIDLLEVDLAEVVIAYIDHLESRGELDLEAATEFLVLIAALLELKSRLLLPGEDMQELIELDPGEAAEELLARLLDAHRYRAASAHLRELLAAQEGHRFRSAPLPPSLRRASLSEASAAYDPATLAAAIGGLLEMPERVDVRHMVGSRGHRGRAARAPARAAAARQLLVRRRGRPGRPGDDRGDPVRAARAPQAGRADVDPGRAVRRDHDRRERSRPRTGAVRHEERLTA